MFPSYTLSLSFLTDPLSKLEFSLIFYSGNVNLLLIETRFWTAKLMCFYGKTVVRLLQKGGKKISYLVCLGQEL